MKLDALISVGLIVGLVDAIALCLDLANGVLTHPL